MSKKIKAFQIKEAPKMLIDAEKVHKWNPFYIVRVTRDLGRGKPLETLTAASQNLFQAEQDAKRDRFAVIIHVATVFPARNGGPVQVNQNGIIHKGVPGAAYSYARTKDGQEIKIYPAQE